MYRKASIGIFLLGILAGGALQAQTVKKLTLKEALDLGVTNSKQLIVSSEKVKEAQAKVSQAKDRIWPEVGVSGMYLHVNTPNISFPSSSEPTDGSGDSGGSGLSSLSNLHDILLGQVSASMPIFNGLKIRNNRIMSQYLAEAAQYDEQTSKNEVLVNTAKALYQFYAVQETRRAIEENLKHENQRVTEFKNLEAQGLLARNDRLKSELQANNVELALTEANNSVQMAEYNLIILLGLPDDSKIELDTTGMFELAKLTNWDDYLQSGLTNRSELKSAGLQIKASDAAYKYAKGNRLPTVALTAGYVNLYIPNVATITNAINAGVSVKWSITGAIHAGHSAHEAKARVAQTEAAEKLTQDRVKVEIRQKYLKCQESLDKLAISERAIVQAEENFSISQNKYKQGLLILSDYLDADVALLQARINYASAKADSMIAYYELQESTGTLQ